MIDIQLAEADWAGVETGVQALLDKWLVPIGAPLLKGQPIASVVLVKASIDIEAPADGTLASILVPAGDSFAIGQTIATFDSSPRVSSFPATTGNPWPMDPRVHEDDGEGRGRRLRDDARWLAAQRCVLGML